ncbi:MAG: PAS domain S-box protein [Chitinophagaceae bacterium]|nr:PAS domain S-box protein [Chitinophagaceae bacterium]
MVSKNDLQQQLIETQKKLAACEEEILTLRETIAGQSTLSEEISSLDFAISHSQILDLIKKAVIATKIDGTIIYWNQQATKIYGWEKEEVIGKNVMELIPTDLSYAEGVAIMELLMKGNTWVGEYTVKNKKGESFKAFVQDSPIMDKSGKTIGIIGVSRDLTEEIETREFIRFQTNLLDSVEQAVVASDVYGNVFYWNRYAEELYGWKKEEILGKPVSILTTDDPEWQEKANTLMENFRSGSSWAGEFLLQHKSGKRFYAYCVNSPIKSEDGEVTGIIVISNDISKELELQREKEFERLNQQALINATTDLIWSVNSKYKLITANTAFVERLKEYTGLEVSAGEFLLKSDFFPVDYIDFWKEKYDRGLKGERLSFEIHVPSMNGIPERWSEATINPILNSQQEIVGVACFGRDITETKIASQRITLSEERFRIMFEAAPLGIALIDSYNGHIYHVNEKFASIAGRTIEELKSIDWMSITHPDDIQEDLDNMKLLNEKKIPGFTMQKRYIKPDGSHVWIQMSIVPIEYREPDNPRHLCMIEDITQMKESIRKIELSNERFNLVAKATNDAIWDWDMVENKVIRLGTGLEKYFGYNSIEASADDDFWSKYVHRDDLTRVLEKRKKILEDVQQSNWSDEYRFLKSNGEYAYVFDKGYIIRDEAGKPVRMIGATQDITEQKKAALLLKELNDTLEKRAHDLERSNAELERFAYVASHDLQEPLRMVSSFLQLLEKKYKGHIDETANKYIHFAVDGAERMKKLIHDLLEYSRAGRSNEEIGDTDMNLVVQEVLETYQTEIQQRNIKVVVDPLPFLPGTQRIQMVQLLQNIIGNAFKYNNSSSPIIEIKSEESETDWQIEVKDNGLGFDTKYSDKIFMIFQRLHNRNEYSGTGIGLAICKKIMELHGGKIHVDSEPGTGSTFYLTFPKIKHSLTDAHNQTNQNSVGGG